MEQPKKPKQLTSAQREFLKLKIAQKAKNNPEFKKIADQAIQKSKDKENQNKD